MSFDREILYVTSSKFPSIDMISIWLSNNVQTAYLNKVLYLEWENIIRDF